MIFVTQFKELNSAAKLQKILKNGNLKNKLSSVVMKDGSFTAIYEETLEVMLEEHFSGNAIEEDKEILGRR